MWGPIISGFCDVVCAGLLDVISQWSLWYCTCSQGQPLSKKKEAEHMGLSLLKL